MMDYARLVLEAVRREKTVKDRAIDAIRKHYEVELSYDADDGINKGKTTRLIQPVAYGLSKAGNEVIRAYQPMGDTETSTPSWKMFRLDRISAWKTMWKRHFKKPPMYNQDNDNSMSTVYMKAKFDQDSNIAVYNRKHEKEKAEKNPLYNLKNNARKSFNLSNFETLKNNVSNNRNKGNLSSIADMQTVNGFGDDTNTQTVGPQMKNNVEPKTNNANSPSYSTALNNGPQYKDIYDQLEKQKNDQINKAWDEYDKNNQEEEDNLDYFDNKEEENGR